MRTLSLNIPLVHVQVGLARHLDEAEALVPRDHSTAQAGGLPPLLVGLSCLVSCRPARLGGGPSRLVRAALHQHRAVEIAGLVALPLRRQVVLLVVIVHRLTDCRCRARARDQDLKYTRMTGGTRWTPRTSGPDPGTPTPSKPARRARPCTRAPSRQPCLGPRPSLRTTTRVGRHREAEGLRRLLRHRQLRRNREPLRHEGHPRPRRPVHLHLGAVQQWLNWQERLSTSPQPWPVCWCNLASSCDRVLLSIARSHLSGVVNIPPARRHHDAASSHALLGRG